ncbi:putative ABC transport system permease protein [Micromonospora phaseoli]|uniref:Putative ABC transport system permease protein n=1 Tax=Micromonospora phaseoli TaxID=1144548 RepID=A0A1H7C3E1_9ACTN|nr:FtsX-like permease family protein [Micromonospora phaseoli]PZV92616.1 putative ABC transport system permease protein [Micromonospora phaseoli]GIJ76731.1 membrane protein [Micromonospora phaseoli]SEJ84393.1 putative ABC transport system permease protein [Micromonospora phaseoli]
MNRWLTRRWPAPHWPSVRGRGRTDAGALLLTAAVIAAVALLAGAVPALLRAAADNAVQDTVRRAGHDSNVLVHANWERDDGPTGGRFRISRLAEDVDDFRARATYTLGPDLDAALLPPIAVVHGPILNVTDGNLPRTFQLTYLAGDLEGPAVTWIAGSAPGPAVPEQSIEIPYDGPPWPVQVGLSEADAAALNLGPGDRIPVQDGQGRDKDVRISGIYRPADSADPAWRLAPALLRPVPGADGVGTTRFAGLLSRESLPDARLAFDEDQLRRTVHFAPEPDVLTWDATATLAGQVVKLKAASGSSGVRDQSLKWESQLDTVLRDARTQISAASAQAAVLLAGVLTTTVLVLLLAADLLVRRRTPALSAARQRGAALPDLGAELIIESTVLSLSAAAVGLALARAAVPGVSWTWTVPVVLAGAVAGPAFGTLVAARASRDRRQPANPAARRWILATGQLRRAAVEAAVLIAAVAAFVTLHRRGLLPVASAGDTGELTGDLVLPISAVALGVLAGALVVLRLLPAGVRFALRQSLRSRRPLAVFGAARAATTAGRALPLLALVSATALASFALVVGTTVARGLVDGAWNTVGADARLDVSVDAEAATPALAERIAAAPGVEQVVVAQVTDSARIFTESTLLTPRLVVVDTAAFQRLLATTPLPDAPALAQITAPGPGPVDVPALVRSSDGDLRTGTRLQLPRDGAPAIRLAAVGTAPSFGGASDVVIVDAAALADAGLPAVPNTVWVTGPGAARAVSNSGVAADVVLRADVLRAQRVAPLTAGVLRLAWTAAAVLLALGLLGLTLAAAASASERWQTLTRLRTLGLRPRDARWVAAGELLPPVVVAAVCGPLFGALLAHLTLGPLELRLLTGQATDPAAALPWWLFGLVSVALLAAAAAVVPVESALRRRDRLSEVLRAGG